MVRKHTISSVTRKPGKDTLQELLSDVLEIENHSNRRSSARMPRSLVLIVQPLDNDLQPIGKAFKAVTRDVSSTGVGFLHETPFPTNFVSIGATQHSMAQSIAQVCYNKTYFGNDVIYLVGVEFINV